MPLGARQHAGGLARRPHSVPRLVWPALPAPLARPPLGRPPGLHYAGRLLWPALCGEAALACTVRRTCCCRPHLEQAQVGELGEQGVALRGLQVLGEPAQLLQQGGGGWGAAPQPWLPRSSTGLSCPAQQWPAVEGAGLLSRTALPTPYCTAGPACAVHTGTHARTHAFPALCPPARPPGRTQTCRKATRSRHSCKNTDL